MGIRREKISIPSPAGPMRALVLRPRGASGKLPGLLWIHGGGYVLGMPSMANFSRARDVVASPGAVVVSPGYRLAGKAPYPAALEDCYAALLHMRREADALGIRDDQIMVGGESAGGGLAAAVSMLARDRGEVAVAYQLPLYPMLDCHDTPTSRDNHGRVWNTRKNHWGWKRYLGGLWGSDDISPYASPAAQTDHSGLPPCYTFVSEGEPFLAETLAYVEALRAAGVEAHVDVYPGNTHAFDMLCPWRCESREAAAEFRRRFRLAALLHAAPQRKP